MVSWLQSRDMDLLSIVILALGAIAVICGSSIKVYKVQTFSTVNRKTAFKHSKVTAALDSITSCFPLSAIKSYLKASLSFCLLDDITLNLAASAIILLLFCLSISIALLLHPVGQLWYTKILLLGMSLLLPFYTTILLIDLYKYRINRQIPRLIDEFRSAFIKHGKIKPALKECGLHIDKGLGKIITRAADSAFLEDSLIMLRSRVKNIWLNIFVILLTNFKENGGELVDQLYRVNRTMTRYNNVERKRGKRLIWYEMFAVLSSIFSIPAVIWLNRAILGSSAGSVTDAQSNVIISRIIVFSLVSLIAVRVLRKM
jgi:hypothetical protein